MPSTTSRSYKPRRCPSASSIVISFFAPRKGSDNSGLNNFTKTVAPMTYFLKIRLIVRGLATILGHGSGPILKFSTKPLPLTFERSPNQKFSKFILVPLCFFEIFWQKHRKTEYFDSISASTMNIWTYSLCSSGVLQIIGNFSPRSIYKSSACRW